MDTLTDNYNNLPEESEEERIKRLSRKNKDVYDDEVKKDINKNMEEAVSNSNLKDLIYEATDTPEKAEHLLQELDENGKMPEGNEPVNFNSPGNTQQQPQGPAPKEEKPKLKTKAEIDDEKNKKVSMLLGRKVNIQNDAELLNIEEIENDEELSDEEKVGLVSAVIETEELYKEKGWSSNEQRKKEIAVSRGIQQEVFEKKAIKNIGKKLKEEEEKILKQDKIMIDEESEDEKIKRVLEGQKQENLQANKKDSIPTDATDLEEARELLSQSVFSIRDTTHEKAMEIAKTNPLLAQAILENTFITSHDFEGSKEFANQGVFGNINNLTEDEVNFVLQDRVSFGSKLAAALNNLAIEAQASAINAFGTSMDLKNRLGFLRQQFGADVSDDEIDTKPDYLKYSETIRNQGKQRLFVSDDSFFTVNGILGRAETIGSGIGYMLGNLPEELIVQGVLALTTGGLGNIARSATWLGKGLRWINKIPKGLSALKAARYAKAVANSPLGARASIFFGNMLKSHLPAGLIAGGRESASMALDVYNNVYQQQMDYTTKKVLSGEMTEEQAEFEANRIARKAMFNAYDDVYLASSMLSAVQSSVFNTGKGAFGGINTLTAGIKNKPLRGTSDMLLSMMLEGTEEMVQDYQVAKQEILAGENIYGKHFTKFRHDKLLGSREQWESFYGGALSGLAMGGAGKLGKGAVNFIKKKMILAPRQKRLYNNAYQRINRGLAEASNLIGNKDFTEEQAEHHRRKYVNDLLFESMLLDKQLGIKTTDKDKSLLSKTKGVLENVVSDVNLAEGGINTHNERGTQEGDTLNSPYKKMIAKGLESMAVGEQSYDANVSKLGHKGAARLGHLKANEHIISELKTEHEKVFKEAADAAFDGVLTNKDDKTKNLLRNKLKYNHLKGVQFKEELEELNESYNEVRRGGGTSYLNQEVKALILSIQGDRRLTDDEKEKRIAAVIDRTQRGNQKFLAEYETRKKFLEKLIKNKDEVTEEYNDDNTLKKLLGGNTKEELYGQLPKDENGKVDEKQKQAIDKQIQDAQDVLDLVNSVYTKNTHLGRHIETAYENEYSLKEIGGEISELERGLGSQKDIRRSFDTRLKNAVTEEELNNLQDEFYFNPGFADLIEQRREIVAQEEIVNAGAYVELNTIRTNGMSKIGQKLLEESQPLEDYKKDFADTETFNENRREKPLKEIKDVLGSLYEVMVEFKVKNKKLKALSEKRDAIEKKRIALTNKLGKGAYKDFIDNEQREGNIKEGSVALLDKQRIKETGINIKDAEYRKLTKQLSEIYQEIESLSDSVQEAAQEIEDGFFVLQHTIEDKNTFLVHSHRERYLQALNIFNNTLPDIGDTQDIVDTFGTFSAIEDLYNEIESVFYKEQSKIDILVEREFVEDKIQDIQVKRYRSEIRDEFRANLVGKTNVTKAEWKFYKRVKQDNIVRTKQELEEHNFRQMFMDSREPVYFVEDGETYKDFRKRIEDFYRRNEIGRVDADIDETFDDTDTDTGVETKDENEIDENEIDDIDETESPGGSVGKDVSKTIFGNNKKKTSVLNPNKLYKKTSTDVLKTYNNDGASLDLFRTKKEPPPKNDGGGGSNVNNTKKEINNPINIIKQAIIDKIITDREGFVKHWKFMQDYEEAKKIYKDSKDDAVKKEAMEKIEKEMEENLEVLVSYIMAKTNKSEDEVRLEIVEKDMAKVQEYINLLDKQCN